MELKNINVNDVIILND